MKNLYLTERWSVSRGRDTYGYNICTIEVADNLGNGATGWELRGVRGRCSGGGYDMAGTSLADCLTQVPEIQARLQALASLEGRYGAYRRKDGSVYIDGACGQSSVISIMESIGVEVRPNYIRKRGGRDERIGWFVTINPEVPA